MRNLYQLFKKLTFLLGALGGFAIGNSAYAATWYSKGNGTPNDLNNWNSQTDGLGASPTSFTVEGDVFIIQATHNMVTTADWVIGSNTGGSNRAMLHIRNGGSLDAQHVITVGRNTIFRIDDGGTFSYSTSMDMASTIFAGTENFLPTSNFAFKALPPVGGSAKPDGAGYGNLIFDIGTGGAYAWNGNITLVQNDFIINKAGGQQVLHNTSANYTLTIGRDLMVNGSILTFANNVASPVITVRRDFVQTNGVVNFTGGTGTGTVIMNVHRNVDIERGSIRNQFTGNAKIVFTNAVSHTFNSAIVLGAAADQKGIDIEVAPGNTLSLLSDMVLTKDANVNVFGAVQLDSRRVVLETGAFNVKGGGMLHAGTGMIAGSQATGGVFNLEDGGSIFIGSPNGIARTGALGNVQTGVRNYYTGGNAFYFYDGVAPQFTGDGLPDQVFGEMLIMNPNGVTLSKSFSVEEGMLDVSGGKLFLGNYDLRIGDNGAISDGSADAYVVQNGTGRMWINNIGGSQGSRTGTVLFPVGTTSGYAPATIENSGVADNFAVRVVNGITDNTGDAVASRVINKTWHVEEAVVGGSNITLSLQWNAIDETEGFNRDSCSISHFTGGTWTRPTSFSVAGPGSVSGSYKVSRSGITSFSPFGVGDNMSPLPVDLLAFTAVKENNIVVLNWATAMEDDNKGFEVQVSEDGVDFSAIGFVKSQNPNSKSVQHYNFHDGNYYGAGYVYYRLKQEDLDGKVNYSPVVAVKLDLASAKLVAYPNPFKDRVTLRVPASQPGQMQLTMLNAIGKTVLDRQVQLRKGENLTEVELDANSPAGMYILIVQTANGKETIRLTRE